MCTSEVGALIKPKPPIVVEGNGVSNCKIKQLCTLLDPYYSSGNCLNVNALYLYSPLKVLLHNITFTIHTLSLSSQKETNIHTPEQPPGAIWGSVSWPRTLQDTTGRRGLLFCLRNASLVSQSLVSSHCLTLFFYFEVI